MEREGSGVSTCRDSVIPPVIADADAAERIDPQRIDQASILISIRNFLHQLSGRSQKSPRRANFKLFFGRFKGQPFSKFLDNEKKK